MDLTVETSGPEQCLIQHIGPVGGSKDNDPAVTAEAIHLGEQLVQRIFPFVIGTKIRISSPGTTHRINLINKYNAGCLLLGLLKEIPDPGGSYTHKHLHKIGARHGKEWHTGLSGHRFGKQCFTCPRRSDKQGAFGDFPSKLRIFIWIFQKIHNLPDLHLGLFQASNIVKIHFHTCLLIKNLGL